MLRGERANRKDKIWKKNFMLSLLNFSSLLVYSVVEFARYIPPLLASKPVSFLLCFPSLYFCAQEIVVVNKTNITGESDTWTTFYLLVHMNLERRYRNRWWYLEVTLQVVQGEPFHPHQPQHWLGRRLCCRAQHNQVENDVRFRNPETEVVITTRIQKNDLI